MEKVNKNEIELKEWNNETHEQVVIGKVKMYHLVRSIVTEQVAEFIGEYMNCGGKDQREGMAIGKIFHSEHRTLQASLYRFCMGIIIGLSEQEYTDGRNELAIRNAKKIAKMVKDGDIEMGWMI